MKQRLIFFLFFCVLGFGTLSAFAEEGIINVGISLFYQPFTFVDSQGYAQGFSVSFMQALCEKMKQTCIFHPMDPYQLFNALDQGQIDAAIGAIAITPEREANYSFTVPYLPSMASFISLLTNGKPLVSRVTPGNLSGRIIGLLQDSFYSAYLARDFSNLQFRFYPDNSHMIDALRVHDVDLVITDTPSALVWVNLAPNHLAIIGPPIQFNFGIGIMVKKGNIKLLNLLNPAIISFTKTSQFRTLIEAYFQGYYMQIFNKDEKLN